MIKNLRGQIKNTFRDLSHENSETHIRMCTNNQRFAFQSGIPRIFLPQDL